MLRFFSVCLCVFGFFFVCLFYFFNLCLLLVTVSTKENAAKAFQQLRVWPPVGRVNSFSTSGTGWNLNTGDWFLLSLEDPDLPGKYSGHQLTLGAPTSSHH